MLIPISEGRHPAEWPCAPRYAINAGRAVKIADGVYQLRYKRDGKRVWEPVGTDAAVALTKLRKKNRVF